MPIPKQVEEAGKAAEELVLNTQGKTMYKSKAAPEGSEEENEVQGEVIDLETKKVVETPEDTVETLKHKLSVLQGKYDKEIVPVKGDVGVLNRQKTEIRNLTKANDDLVKRTSDLSVLVADLQKTITEPKKEVEEPAGNVTDFIPTELLSAEDMTVLDDEGLGSNVLGIFAKMISAVAQKAAPAPVEPDTKLETRVETLEKGKQEDASTTYWNTVIRGVSGEKDLVKAEKVFDALNNSVAYNTWLDTTDTFSGKTRRVLLNEAGSGMDASRVIGIFNTYQSSLKKPAPKKKPLESEIEVSSSNATHVLTENDASIDALRAKWHPVAIKAFYADVTKGAYTSKEQAALEAEIWKVQQNNSQTI
jgi:hypothetical protein